MGRTPISRLAPLSAWTPVARVARRHGNADLRSAQPAAGGRREGPRPPGWLPCRRGPQQRRWRAGTGTPTSGQFSRWGPAQPAAGGRMGRTPISRMAPPVGVDPSSAGGAQARERRPLASSPGGGRHSPPQAGGGKDPDPPDGPPLGVDPSSAGGAQARERRPPAARRRGERRGRRGRRVASRCPSRP